MNKKYYKLVGESFVCVPGRKIIIKGYEEFEFFIHRPVYFKGNFPKGNWTLSEAKTGASVMESLRTQADVKKMASSFLKGISKRRMKEFISNCVKAHGISPRYKEEKCN